MEIPCVESFVVAKLIIICDTVSDMHMSKEGTERRK